MGRLSNGLGLVIFDALALAVQLVQPAGMPSSDPPIESSGNVAPPVLPGLSAFAACLGTRFRIPVAATTTLELELVATAPLGPATPPRTNSPTMESFSLVFQGPGGRLLPQRIYTFDHDRLGVFDLFIVPIGQVPEGYRYEAVVNRFST